MGEEAIETGAVDIPEPDISHIVTEDDEPVDNIFSAKQQHLLTEPLNSFWKPGKSFIALANVGVFYGINIPPVVPDMFLSLDVQFPQDVWEKKNRSYFLWEYGKPPEVVVEIVSNTEGGETDKKSAIYSKIGVWYYIVFDPLKQVQKDALRVFELSPGDYIHKLDNQLQKAGLGVTLWEGAYDGLHAVWLRWVDTDGTLIPTGAENTRREQKRAEKERERAEKEQERAEKLAAKLRSMGIDPDEIA